MTNDKWQELAATSSESLTKTFGPEKQAAVRVPVSILVFWAVVNTDVGGQYWRRWSICSSVNLITKYRDHQVKLGKLCVSCEFVYSGGPFKGLIGPFRIF